MKKMLIVVWIAYQAKRKLLEPQISGRKIAAKDRDSIFRSHQKTTKLHSKLKKDFKFEFPAIKNLNKVYKSFFGALRNREKSWK